MNLKEAASSLATNVAMGTLGGLVGRYLVAEGYILPVSLVAEEYRDFEFDFDTAIEVVQFGLVIGVIGFIFDFLVQQIGKHHGWKD